MVIFEALNALYGDCLLLRYPGEDNKERLWIIDGGPKNETVDGEKLAVWKDVLLPRLKEISGDEPAKVALGMVSHIDDDHINGVQKLTATLVATRPGRPPAVKFNRFWFNSFDELVGPKPAGAPAEVANVATQSLVDELLPEISDDHARLIMQSVAQGVNLASDLRALNLHGNKPVNGLIMAKRGKKPISVEGAKATIIGPLEKRIEKLRKEWIKALKKKEKKARQAALQELFLPKAELDSSVPNLSSIVVLVEVAGRKLLLTGDAHGDDIVTAWRELGLGDEPVEIDLLKLPHHGSIRNVTKQLLEFFVAEHYVFSANGKYENPDAQAIEALVKMHGRRKITMHFTNGDVSWSSKYKLEKGGKSVKTLLELLDALRGAYPGPWDANMRAPDELSVVVKMR